VSVSTKGEQKKNTEYQQYAIERFHGSLHCGLSSILASRESHEPSGNQGGQILKENGSPFSERPSLFGKTVAFLFVVRRSRSHTSEAKKFSGLLRVCEVVDEAVPIDAPFACEKHERC